MHIYHLIPLIFTPAAIGILFALIFSRTLPSRAGEMLTFVSNTTAIHELRLADLNRGLVHTLARSRLMLFRSPVWSPNGRFLAYVTEESLESSELVVMSMDGNQRFRLAGRGVGQFRPVWSPDSDQLAFAYAGGTLISSQSDIYLLDVPCALKLKSCDNPLRNLTDTPADEREPIWSPDGKHIAFVSDQEGQRDIYAMDINGNNWVNLTRSPSEDFSPVWSPDGTRIAFVSDRARNYEIFVMDALTGDALRNVSLNRAEEWSPAWSPDSQHLTFISDETGNYQIYLLTLDKQRVRNLTHHNSSDFSPAWSPDGKHIAFVSNRNESQQIYLLNIDCGVTAEDCIVPVMTTRTEGSTPVWRP